MNSRYTLMTVLLLTSLSSQNLLAKYYDCDLSLEDDRHCMMSDGQRALTDEDCKIALGALLADKFLPGYERCSFNPRERALKVALKYALNRFFFKNSINVAVDLPSAQVVLINTDQFLEVFIRVAEDVFHHKHSSSVVLGNAAKVYVREKIVGVLVWLLEQSNLEELLPNGVSKEFVYRELRNEVARYYTDRAIHELCNRA